MNTAFKYIDDDLQDMKQLLSFRLDDVMPQQPENPGSEYQTMISQDLFHPSTSTNIEDDRRLGSFQCNKNSSEREEPNKCKPPFHYSDLIEFALSDKAQRTVSDIYEWILHRFPYFRNVDESRWKPAVRHTLTTNPGFYKAKKANRGYLWAYRSPKQRHLMEMQDNSAQCTDVVDNKYHNWKKKICAAQANISAANSHVQPSAAVAPKQQHSVSQNDSPQPRHSNTDEQVSKTPSSAPTKQISEVLLPLIPTLQHYNKTLIADSSDNSDEDSACGECTCKVEYFIPRLPSHLNLTSNSATCIPCCKGASNRTENNSSCCCLTANGCCQSENNTGEWSELWNQVHGPVPNNTAVPVGQSQDGVYTLRSSSSTRLLLPSLCGKRAEKTRTDPQKCLVLAHAPSVKETKSGHMLCLPIVVPVYKKAAVLNHSVDSAKLHEVPQAVAVAESGLLDGSPNMSQLTSVPSSHSVCSSQSATRALDAMFRLDDAPRPSDDHIIVLD